MKKTLIILLSACLFASCQPSDEELAKGCIERGGLLIAQGEWNAALNTLDSVDTMFPKLVSARREAKFLKDSIGYMQALRSLEYTDSQLLIAEPKLDSLLNLFELQKDEKYQTEGTLLSRRFMSSGNSERTFLQASVSEKGQPFVRSVYYGSKPLNHTDLSIAAAEDATTHITAIKAPHVFDNHEFLTFEGDNAMELLKFVANHEREKLKVTISGDSQFSYFITAGDATALTQTYELALAFSDVNTLRRNADAAQFTIAKWKNQPAK